MLKNRELARPLYRDPDTGELWITDPSARGPPGVLRLEARRAGDEGDFMEWYKRVAEVEPFSHK